jgi:hypothetical protein
MMKNNMQKYLIWVIALGMGCMGFAAYMYNKPHKNIAATAPDYSLSAATFYQEFEENEPMANERYLNKVVAVNGNLTGIEMNENGNPVLVLETGSPFGGIRCTMEAGQYSRIATFEEGMEVEVKGICTGMLLDVILVQSVLVNPK